MAKAPPRPYLVRAEVAIAAALIAIAAVGVALMPLTSAPAVRALVRAVDAERITGLTSGATLAAAESVRIFVLDADAPPLADRIEGEAAFDESAVSHLVDVRRVLVPSRWLTLALVVLGSVWGAARLRSGDGRQVIGRALKAAGFSLIGMAAAVVLAGVSDFDRLFTLFHGLFFEAGTWTFPASALLIRVFPLPFWQWAGAIWGGTVLMFAGVLVAVGRRLCFTQRGDGV